jgi:hypothetical protein
MRLPDQPSFQLPAQSPMASAGKGGAYGTYGPPTYENQQSASAYRETASRPATRKAKRREPMIVAQTSGTGRNL